MGISITKILSCESVEELKLLDSYLELKRSLEEKLGFKLHVKGWASLFKRIDSLKTIISKKKYELETIADNQSLAEAKREVVKILGFKLSAKGRSEFKQMLQSLISLFSNCMDNPYERYELTKNRNFIHSSRLEGIEISANKSEHSLESILERYKVSHG